MRKKVQRVVSEDFDAGEGLALTKPTFFSRIGNKVRDENQCCQLETLTLGKKVEGGPFC